jgi:hypothetical protein
MLALVSFPNLFDEIEWESVVPDEENECVCTSSDEFGVGVLS